MPKLLVEFLKEQQEPFALDVYLLERGYSIKRRRRRDTIRKCSKQLVKALLFGKRLLIKTTGAGDCDEEDDHVFSSPSATTVYDSCSQTDSEEDAHFSEVDAGRELKKWRSVDDINYKKKQLSPNSVLEETDEQESSPLHQNYVPPRQDYVKINVDAGFFEEQMLTGIGMVLRDETGEVLMCKTVVYPSVDKGEAWGVGEALQFVTELDIEKVIIEMDVKNVYDALKANVRQGQYNSKTTQEFEASNSCTRYIINKRAMQQSKQLLVDCVREVIENQRRKDNKNGEQLKRILGSDELWKLLCENVWLWSQDSIDVTNILQLLHFDFMASEKEWTCAFEEHRNEACVEIGDAILEAIIEEIIVTS